MLFFLEMTPMAAMSLPNWTDTSGGIFTGGICCLLRPSWFVLSDWAERSRHAQGCGHIHLGLGLSIPWWPEPHCCLLPGTEPFIHEKCPQLKQQPYTHRRTLCIQKEINSTYSPATCKSHRGFGSASVNCMGEEFDLSSFFIVCFSGFFSPPRWASPHSAELCCAQIFTLLERQHQSQKGYSC